MALFQAESRRGATVNACLLNARLQYRRMANEANPPRKRGCFFYGCLTLIVAMLVFAVAGVVAFRYVQRKVNDYADTKPMAIEKGDTSPEKLNAIQKRIDAFKEGVATQNTPQELALSADEINSLLASQPDLQRLSSRLSTFIEGDQLKAKLAWPLDDIGFKGRYFNGTATLKVSASKGDLDLHIDDVQTQNNKPLPAPIVENLRRHDFADDLQRDAQTAAALRLLDSVQVKDGRVIIRSKPGG
jgi:hypothetical protein